MFDRRQEAHQLVGLGISGGVAVGEVNLHVRIKFGDSKANRFRDMQPAHFVIDNERQPAEFLT